MDEGTAKEYAVKSATALIFQKYGSDEGSYKFVESVTLPIDGWTDDPEDGITTTSKKLTAKLTNVDTKNTYAVLVLLNNKTASGVKITLPSVGQSYNEWNNNAQLPTVTDLAAENDFYMANAPLKVDASPTTLVTIDKDNSQYILNIGTSHCGFGSGKEMDAALTDKIIIDDEGNITSSPISSNRKASKKVVYDRETSGSKAILFSINKYKVKFFICIKSKCIC